MHILFLWYFSILFKSVSAYSSFILPMSNSKVLSSALHCFCIFACTPVVSNITALQTIPNIIYLALTSLQYSRPKFPPDDYLLMNVLLAYETHKPQKETLSTSSQLFLILCFLAQYLIRKLKLIFDSTLFLLLHLIATYY